MLKLKLREVIMQESRNSSKREHWWKWESNSKEWWGHPMLNSNFTHNLDSLMVRPIKHPNLKLLTRAPLVWIMVHKDVLKAWQVALWLEKRIYRTWEIRGNTNLVKTSMACNNKIYKTWSTVAQIMSIWLISYNNNCSSQSILECFKQLCLARKLSTSHWLTRPVVPSQWILAVMLSNCTTRTSSSTWATYHSKRLVWALDKPRKW